MVAWMSTAAGSSFVLSVLFVFFVFLVFSVWLMLSVLLVFSVFPMISGDVSVAYSRFHGLRRTCTLPPTLPYSQNDVVYIVAPAHSKNARVVLCLFSSTRNAAINVLGAEVKVVSRHMKSYSNTDITE